MSNYRTRRGISNSRNQSKLQ